MLECGREQLDNFVLTVDEAVVSLAHDGFLLCRCGHVGEDAPSLGDEVDLAFGVVAAAHGVAVVVVGTEEPGSVPCVVLYGLDKLSVEAGQLLAVGKVGTGCALGDFLHLGQKVGKEECHPDALAFAFDTHTAHTVVPVAAAHEG